MEPLTVNEDNFLINKRFDHFIFKRVHQGENTWYTIIKGIKWMMEFPYCNSWNSGEERR